MQWPIFLAPLAFGLLVFMPLVFLRRRREDALGHTNVSLHKNLRSASVLGKLGTLVLASVYLAMILALARPVLPYTQQTQSVEARDIILAEDISGSMGSYDIPGDLSSLLPPGITGCTIQQDPNSYNPGNGQLRRLDAACYSILNFVVHRPHDRIGLIEFDDQAYWLLPLFYDNHIVVNKAKLLNSRLGGGTNFEGPTQYNNRMGPIQAAINHFLKYGQSKSRILIMVTDGEDSISAERMTAFQEQLTQYGIKLYVLGVGADWSNTSNTPDLQKLAESVGGQVFRVADANAMQQAFDTINKLEPSQIHLEQTKAYTDLYPYLVGYALIGLIFYLVVVFVTREKP